MTTCMEKSCSFGLLPCLSWAFVKLCVCSSLPIGKEGRKWDVIALIPVHCLSVYFPDKLGMYQSEILFIYLVNDPLFFIFHSVSIL